MARTSQAPDLGPRLDSTLPAGWPTELQFHARPRRLEERAVLHVEGDPIETISVVTYGILLSLNDTFSMGEKPNSIVDLYGPGDLVGLDGLLNEEERVQQDTAQAPANTAARLLTFDRDFLLRALRENQTLRRIADKQIAVQIRRFRDKVAMLGLDSIERIDVTISRLAERFGKDPGDGTIRLDPSFLITEIASMVGTSPETVSRRMAQLKREGVLKGDGSSLIIKKRGTYRFI